MSTHFPRRSGVLLHPTSLPGADGIGDLGQGAYRFVDWLHQHGQSLWQVLPLGPTSFGDSPYQTLSAFAGNPLLIDLEKLVELGWLLPEDLSRRPAFDEDRVDFGPVIEWKSGCLARAWERFQAGAKPEDRELFAAFRQEQAAWLDDFALFMALKEENGGRAWCDWPAALVKREARALTEATGRLDGAIGRIGFIQWLFHRQWLALKEYAAARGIQLVGDLPIFVAYDSADVWAHSHLFQLDKDGRPTHVAGVPPDYFSKTGQLWGNPLYRWEAMAETGFAWWRARLRQCLEMTDVVRIDHFRGFAAFWQVKAGAKTAVDGAWMPGPGAAFFAAMREEFGEDLPLIAEDLGVITPDVQELRDQFALPGMKVLQFAWSGPDNAFLPHEHVPNCVVYSGTHDNDPTLGWWEHLTDARTRALVADYTGQEKVAEPHWTLLRLGMASCAHTFIATMQDVLGLGRKARMNLPGEGKGNWNWRMRPEALADEAGQRLGHLTWLYRRRPDQSLPDESLPEQEQTEELEKRK
ncbi:4-alpha-glucanotransferase [bacterium DOLZORAL124_64_63]|nr:MAG: 4-alpha-glucanotransferase [bacterium DOLZORAL124_64_63]